MKNDLMNCRACVDLLVDYLDGNLDEKTQSDLDKHFSTCPPCVNFLETYKSSAQVTTVLRDQEVEVPAAMEERLRSFLREQLSAGVK
ncbi:MAG: zf-HC2 domain-containing protein [Acidobacteriota bacterium]